MIIGANVGLHLLEAVSFIQGAKKGDLIEGVSMTISGFFEGVSMIIGANV